MASMIDPSDADVADGEATRLHARPDIAEGRVRAGGKSMTAFRTISEVSADLDVPQHVLRFWESKFTQLRPLKRGGGRRYYRPEDIALLRRIHALLYREGYTIKGVQRLLRAPKRLEKEPPAPETETQEFPAQKTIAPEAPEISPQLPIPGMETKQAVVPSDKLLRDLLSELKSLRGMLA